MAIYNGKHCVFEQVGLDADTLTWNASSNTDNDGAYNDWNISDMRNTNLPAHLLLLSNDLQGVITNTTIQTATNGNNGALVSTSDKLFFAAEKEMSGTRYQSRTEEFNTLTTWSYWTTHTSASNRIKYVSSTTARYYWLRSPHSGDTYGVVNVSDSGNFITNGADNSYRFSLCYAF